MSGDDRLRQESAVVKVGRPQDFLAGLLRLDPKLRPSVAEASACTLLLLNYLFMCIYCVCIYIYIYIYNYIHIIYCFLFVYLCIYLYYIVTAWQSERGSIPGPLSGEILR